eukprot:GEZU01017740.1.p1 GENE.GEZU01017740.1~~GEZU01017740.1.p1  ORF type:complete len:105 (+),score=9.86 GEZU01017740.1:464-778(+)
MEWRRKILIQKNKNNKQRRSEALRIIHYQVKMSSTVTKIIDKVCVVSIEANTPTQDRYQWYIVDEEEGTRRNVKLQSIHSLLAPPTPPPTPQPRLNASNFCMHS